MRQEHGDTVSSLIGQLGTGDPNAAGRLVERLYPELKRLAVARMSRERAEHTWQPSALVNELYVELVKSHQLRVSGHGARDDKAAFFGLASHIMSRLLIRHARRLYLRVTKSSLDDCEDILPAAGQSAPDQLYAIDAVLMKLEAINPRLRTVVELRVFEGLSGDEIAERLGCSRRTAIRDWNFAKNLICAELSVKQQ
jgi:RNA polymerase sigma factor (TIGR02999 family)